MRGAQAAGHTVERCDCARLNLHPLPGLRTLWYGRFLRAPG